MTAATSITRRWKRTSPLAAVFYLGRIYKAVAQNAVQSFAPLAAYIVATEGNIVARIAIAAAAFFAITVIAAFVRYLFFRYQVTDDSILIREGVFTKTQLDIKYDRIQAINTLQNIVYRPFDLVTVKLDTAGSAGQEGHLPAIKTALADELKERSRRSRKRKPDDIEAGDDAESDNEPGRTVLELGNADMLRIGLSSNRALVFLVFLGPLWERMDDRIESLLADYTTVDLAELSLVAGLAVVLGLVFAVLIVLVIASIIGAFLRYHRFRLEFSDGVLRSTGGLLTRHEHSIRPAKIQSLASTQNIMLRFFDGFRLRARQASSGKSRLGKDFIVPICKASHVDELQQEIFGAELADGTLDPAADHFHKISPHYMRSRILLFGVVPAAVMVAISVADNGWGSLIFLLWLLPVALITWLAYRRYGFSVTVHGILLRRGILGFRVLAFLQRKVQRVTVTQSLLQKRRGLATMRFYLASGSVKLPFVPYELAARLRDQVLYQVESSDRAWH